MADRSNKEAFHWKDVDMHPETPAGQNSDPKIRNIREVRFGINQAGQPQIEITDEVYPLARKDPLYFHRQTITANSLGSIAIQETSQKFKDWEITGFSATLKTSPEFTTGKFGVLGGRDHAQSMRDLWSQAQKLLSDDRAEGTQRGEKFKAQIERFTAEVIRKAEQNKTLCDLPKDVTLAANNDLFGSLPDSFKQNTPSCRRPKEANTP